jgi:hypothetical protein
MSMPEGEFQSVIPETPPENREETLGVAAVPPVKAAPPAKKAPARKAAPAKKPETQPTITVTVEPELKELIRQRAEIEERTESVIVRRAVRAYMQGWTPEVAD